MLIRGPSGAGKSTLALALIDAWRRTASFAALVADDQTVVWAAHGAVIAAPHPNLGAVMERRGLGFIRPPALFACRVGLVVDLVAPVQAPRLPEEDAHTTLCDVALPNIALPSGGSLENCLILSQALQSDGRRTHLAGAPGPSAAAADAAP